VRSGDGLLDEAAVGLPLGDVGAELVQVQLGRLGRCRLVGDPGDVGVDDTEHEGHLLLGRTAQRVGPVWVGRRPGTREFEVELHGIAEFPATGNRHAGFSSTGQLSRKELGLHFPALGPAANLLGDKVSFEIDVELLEPKDEGAGAP
jgi:hypothetical protein